MPASSSIVCRNVARSVDSSRRRVSARAARGWSTTVTSIGPAVSRIGRPRAMTVVTWASGGRVAAASANLQAPLTFLPWTRRMVVSTATATPQRSSTETSRACLFTPSRRPVVPLPAGRSRRCPGPSRGHRRAARPGHERGGPDNPDLYGWVYALGHRLPRPRRRGLRPSRGRWGRADVRRHHRPRPALADGRDRLRLPGAGAHGTDAEPTRPAGHAGGAPAPAGEAPSGARPAQALRPGHRGRA